MSISAFRANSEDVTGKAIIGSDMDPERIHAKEMSERAAAKVQEELLGLPGGSVVSVSGRAGSDTQIKTAKQNAERQGASARAATDVALWVALMRQGELDAFIAEQMFAGMSDEEIMDLSGRIESETGKSVEDWAGEILGDDMPERMPNESDADYHRRLQIAMTEEMLGEDGKLLPEYSDHPLAPFIRDNAIYQEVLPIAEEAARMLEDGATLDEAKQRLEDNEVLDGGMRNEFASAVVGNKTELDNELREDRDVGSDNDFEGPQNTSENNTAFDMFS